MKIVHYETRYFEIWNAFIKKAKNATFLFDRNFMEYHSDRFTDFSLLVFDEKEKLVAVLPANRVGDTLYSHQGLTYGGVVLTENAKLVDVITIFKSILLFLNNQGIQKLQLKQIPTFYCNYFSDEMEYILFLVEAKLYRKDALSVLDLNKTNFVLKGRRQNIRRGEKYNLEIRKELNFELFWNEILIPNLSQKHQVNPVHSVKEIELLRDRFPENISHFNVYHEGKIVAGTTVFTMNNVVHPQYISGNEDKNKLGSLDFLYNYLITQVSKGKSIFDFGISNEEQGRKLNEGLIFWKESFGAKTVVQNFYEIPTQNYMLLENVLI
jgi:hypothetical protein